MLALPSGGIDFAKKFAQLPLPVAPDMQQQAEYVAASMIDPQVAAVNRAILAKQQLMGGQSQAYSGVIDALSRMTAGTPEAIRSAYQTSADRTAGYAGSLTGTLGDTAKSAAAAAAQHIASLGAPGTVTSVAPAAMNVANYQYGTLPSSSLAAEAASRLAEAQGLRTAGGLALGQQALAALNATRGEISELQARGLDIENTRPGEIQKALASLREEGRANQALTLQEKNFKLQARAEGVQESQLNRAWLQTLNTEAFNRTNATGTLWVVKGNKLMDTGRPAPGSAAGRAKTSAAQQAANRRAGLKKAALSAKVQRERIAAQNAHNVVEEGISNARLGVSQQQADIAKKREAAYEQNLIWKQKHPGKKATGAAGGMSDAEVRQYGQTAGNAAYTLFYGQKNPNFDPEKPTSPTNPIYATAPGSASDAMKYMLSKSIPYSIAWNAIYQYATRKNSHWADALGWNPKYKPPSRKGK